ncbi:MAG: adenosylcobinamide-phosphate synthase CbiB [Pseudomonadota bacterium]
MTLALAMVLDSLFGEPRWLWDRAPHPAVLIGRAIAWADRRLNRGDGKRAKGITLIVGLVAASIAIGAVIAALGWPFEALAAAILLAQRSLVDHVQSVADGLRLSLAEGRDAVAMIVGRDTNAMDDAAVSRAAIESAAENLSDGVIAPLFWFAIAGLPGMLAYKAVNTADSMIGYLTPKHAEFGWAAAKLDDLLNWVPARLTALLILASQTALERWPEVKTEAPRHRSPNAGWPESALARSLDIALSGPRAYEGEMRDFPFVNPDGLHDLRAPDIERAISALWRAWALALALVIAIEAIF